MVSRNFKEADKEFKPRKCDCDARNDKQIGHFGDCALIVKPQHTPLKVRAARFNGIEKYVVERVYENRSEAEAHVRAVNSFERLEAEKAELIQMLEHLDSWLRDSFFQKDDAYCLQKAYEVAQAIIKAEGR